MLLKWKRFFLWAIRVSLFVALAFKRWKKKHFRSTLLDDMMCVIVYFSLAYFFVCLFLFKNKHLMKIVQWLWFSGQTSILRWWNHRSEIRGSNGNRGQKEDKEWKGGMGRDLGESGIHLHRTYSSISINKKTFYKFSRAMTIIMQKLKLIIRPGNWILWVALRAIVFFFFFFICFFLFGMESISLFHDFPLHVGLFIAEFNIFHVFYISVSILHSRYLLATVVNSSICSIGIVQILKYHRFI